MIHDNSATLSRRRFLTRGAMAASAMALPCYIPASVLGREGAVPPSERIVMGAIGLGGRGSSDLDWMLGQTDVQFVAVCDVRRGNREGARNAVNRKYGNQDCTAYRDMRELLAERKDVDAVLLGTRWRRSWR